MANAAQDMDVYEVPDQPEYNDKLLPAGAHAVVVDRAVFEIKKPFLPVNEKTGKPNPDKPTVVLMMSPQTPYTDTDGGSWKTLWLNLSISKFETSKMFTFFPAVFGFPVDELKAVVRDKKIDGQGKEVLHCPQFDGLKFSVVISLGKNQEGKPKNTVESFFATPEQQAANAKIFRLTSPEGPTPAAPAAGAEAAKEVFGWEGPKAAEAKPTV